MNFLHDNCMNIGRIANPKCFPRVVYKWVYDHFVIFIETSLRMQATDNYTFGFIIIPQSLKE